MGAFFASAVGKVVVVALSIAVLLWAVHMIQKTYTASIEAARIEGDKAGYDRARKELAERDNQQLQAALTKVKDLEEKRRELEQQAADEIRAAEQRHSKEVADEQAKSAALAAAVRSGQRRLRDAQGLAAACAPAGGDGRPATAAAPATGGDGAGGCELSGRTAEALLAIGDRANVVVHRLRLCQATVTTYLKECR